MAQMLRRFSGILAANLAGRAGGSYALAAARVDVFK
jgi:hypothetical protein